MMIPVVPRHPLKRPKFWSFILITSLQLLFRIQADDSARTDPAAAGLRFFNQMGISHAHDLGVGRFGPSPHVWLMDSGENHATISYWIL